MAFPVMVHRLKQSRAMEVLVVKQYIEAVPARQLVTALIIMAASTCSVSADLLKFEDLPTTTVDVSMPLPTGYGGVEWSYENTRYINTYLDNVFQGLDHNIYGSHSLQPYFSMISPEGTLINLNSFSFYQHGLYIEPVSDPYCVVSGHQGSVLLYEEIEIGYYGDHTIELNWVGLTDFQVGYRGGPGDPIIDNIDFDLVEVDPVPVPGAFALATLGLSLAGWKLRRRNES